MKTHTHPSRLRRRGAAAAAVLVLALGGCSRDTLLDVDDPDVTLPEALFDPANIGPLRAGAIGDFAVAFGGSSTTFEGVVNAGGLFADEFYHSGTFQGNRELDRRTVNENTTATVNIFRNLHRARRMAELGVQAHAENLPNTANHAEMLNLAGYTYVFFAEHFCSGVPVGTEDASGALVPGQPLTTAQLFTEATSRFDQAITVATAAGTDGQSQLNLARLGKARVLMDLDQYAAAAALVAGIPTSFRYEVQFSDNTARQNNGVWGLNQGRREYGMAHLEGRNGLAFRGGSAASPAQADPRSPWSIDQRGAADPQVLHVNQLKYPARGSAVVLAGGVEARLIQAEALLNRGQSAGYLPGLNELRAGAGLTPLADPGSPAARVDQFFRERAFFLFLTGHRMNDLRRLVRQYGRSAESVFPTGPYSRPSKDGDTPRFDGQYGTDVDWVIPFDETNNPNFTGCLSRGP